MDASPHPGRPADRAGRLAGRTAGSAGRTGGQGKAGGRRGRRPVRIRAGRVVRGRTGPAEATAPDNALRWPAVVRSRAPNLAARAGDHRSANGPVAATRRAMTASSQPESAHLPDLAARELGSSVVAATDELFAGRENLIKAEPPVFQPHTFGLKGQIMDGWETRRRRSPG